MYPLIGIGNLWLLFRLVGNRSTGSFLCFFLKRKPLWCPVPAFIPEILYLLGGVPVSGFLNTPPIWFLSLIPKFPRFFKDKKHAGSAELSNKGIQTIPENFALLPRIRGRVKEWKRYF
jgi:hypothetical protein